MNKLIRAVEKTRRYGEKYGVSYGFKEISKRLISPRVYREEQLLEATGNFKSTENIYVKEKTDKVKRLAEKLAAVFPEILFAGITGSVAAGTPEEDSDIDLMLITKKNCLWLTRLRLRFYIFCRGIPHRKYGEVERKDDFCFNLWLQEDSLRLPKNKQNLKNAMDLILMDPVLNIDQTYEKFIQANGWAKRFVATGYNQIDISCQISDVRKRTNSFLAALNWLSFWPQYWYMKPKISGGLVDQKRAFFHPNDSK